MITRTIGRRMAATVLAALSTAVAIAGSGAGMAMASAAIRPDPGGGSAETSLSAWTTSTAGEASHTVLPECPLRRLGTQLVRCDLLTGAGVAAPAFIPEWTR